MSEESDLADELAETRVAHAALMARTSFRCLLDDRTHEITNLAQARHEIGRANERLRMARALLRQGIPK